MIFIGYPCIGKSTLSLTNMAEGCHVATILREWFKVGNRYIPNHFDIIDNITKQLYKQHISTALMCDPLYYEINVNRNTFDGPVYLDLDSEVFYVNGKRDPRWYVVYAKIAMELSLQGFYVFTSSHGNVRNEIRKLSFNEQYFEKFKIYNIYPVLELEKEWVDKLHVRWLATGLEKDHKAFCFASINYRASFYEIRDDNLFNDIQITDINYDLRQLIENRVNDDGSNSTNVSN